MKKRSSIHVAIMRANPPTRGHEIVLNSILESATKPDADHLVIVSSSSNTAYDPLSSSQKMHYLRHFFPNVNFEPLTRDEKFITDKIKTLNFYYDRINIYCGSDRFDTYFNMMSRCTKVGTFAFSGWLITKVGADRIESTNPTSTAEISASLARRAVSMDDYELFRTCMPSTAYDFDVLNLYEDLRNICSSINKNNKGRVHEKEDKENFSS